MVFNCRAESKPKLSPGLSGGGGGVENLLPPAAHPRKFPIKTALDVRSH